MAGLLRRAKQSTGKPLRSALRVTVTRDNLSGVVGTVRWARANALGKREEFYATLSG